VSEAKFEGSHPGPEWLSAWHDGELQDSAAAAVGAHLEACADCRNAIEAFRQLDQSVRQGDDARPAPEAWEAIERRLRLRLEDELGLGVPMGATRRYVESDAELVLLPTPREIQTGRGARPFRLRWAMATAAGLTVALLTIRTISDRDWTVGKVINPVPDRHREVAAVEPLPSTHQEAEERLRNMKSANATSGGNAPVVAAPSPAASSPAAPNLAGPPATAPSETEVARPEKALEKFEVATSPREYLAEVDQVIRKEAALGSTQSAPASDLSMDESRSWGVAARNSAEAGKTSAQSSTDPEYAMVFAAASRAREAGNQALARRGFALVRAGIPEDDLAREAEYEETLATARMEIANGGDQVVITQRLNDDAASSWDAHAPDQKLTCRTALADLRAAMTLARELGRPLPLEDVDTRLQQLRSCAR